MPYPRPTLATLQQQAAQDVTANLPSADPLLRFAALFIIAQKVLPNAANLMYAYLDYISLQCTPYTATDEFLAAWGALKNVFINTAEQANNGSISFPAAMNGVTYPAGSTINRGDGVGYTTTVDVVSGAGVLLFTSGKVVASADPTGLTGAFGNCAINTVMNLGTATAGISSQGAVTVAFTNGTDLETQGSFRTRVLAAYQSIQGIKNAAWFEQEAKDLVPIVTRAWAIPNLMGGGTIVVYFMMDEAEEAFNGYPQGTNGVATDETRDTVATGDQLAVANALFPVQGAFPLLYASAPAEVTQAHTVTGLSGASAGVKNAIIAAIADVYIRNATAKGGTIDVQDLQVAIASVAGSSGAVLTVPSANITTTIGELIHSSGVTFP